MTTSGIQLIAEERRRQIDRWTPEHDADHTDRELVQAAVAYLLYGSAITIEETHAAEEIWPWPNDLDPHGDPNECLAKAGALIAAELDRRLA